MPRNDAPSAPALNVRGAFIRRIDLSRASLRGANLARADASGAIFRGSDFHRAILDGTVLKGADLRDAINLTVEQLASAILDETTQLPDYIDRAKIPALVQPS